jgi:hypothetical protein
MPPLKGLRRKLKMPFFYLPLFLVIAAAYSTATIFFCMELATFAAEITDMLAKSLLHSIMAATPHSQHIEYSFTSGAL